MKPKAWAKRDYDKARIRGRALQRIRREMFAADPTCAECGRLLHAGVKWEVDHVQALAHGGAETAENRRLLCAGLGSCHEAKSLQDRGIKPKPKIGLDGWPET